MSFFFSSLWALPTYKYEAERVDPATNCACYLTLTISNFDVTKGAGHFEIVWIEDRTPHGSTATASMPETREIVTFTGKAETSFDVARLGSFASIGIPWKNRGIGWKTSQGPLPTFSVLTKVEDIIAGTPQISLDFVPVSQKDANGKTQALLQQRDTERFRCILEGSKESVTIEFKGEKIDGGLESYFTLSFTNLDKNTGKGQFTIDWVEDYTPSFGKTTREVVEVKGTVEATVNGIITLSPYNVYSKSKITLARLSSVASLSLPFSTTEVVWSMPKGYQYDGVVPKFTISGTLADIVEGKTVEINFDYVRLCQDTSKIVAKEKQQWKLTTTALLSTINSYISTFESYNWNEVVPVTEQVATETATTTTTTTTTEPHQEPATAEAAETAVEDQPAGF